MLKTFASLTNYRDGWVGGYQASGWVSEIANGDSVQLKQIIPSGNFVRPVAMTRKKCQAGTWVLFADENRKLGSQQTKPPTICYKLDRTNPSSPFVSSFSAVQTPHLKNLWKLYETPGV